ncbi:hypothetical protein [Haloarcula sebkhae]|uniref:Uncharacterized protein n=2 Tax=Haloarcula sebkhae TaxID=932660 RepID=A0ACC6VM60_9EURY|nr:hypothetical protein [Haloarcula sebkhae]GGK84389.1 hypothetical protein GCM10009067_40740 [Haloarcula sebkhae]
MPGLRGRRLQRQVRKRQLTQDFGWHSLSVSKDGVERPRVVFCDLSLSSPLDLRVPIL